MIAVDSSVAIAAFGSWHALHEPAADLLASGVAIPAHALLETYSVLTGFPPPHRAPAAIVEEWLTDRFPNVLDPSERPRPTRARPSPGRGRPHRRRRLRRPRGPHREG